MLVYPSTLNCSIAKEGGEGSRSLPRFFPLLSLLPLPSLRAADLAPVGQDYSKHVAEQKRGVTTSYKNVEPYTQFHKIALFLVVMGVIIGLGSHGIDTGIE